MRPLRHHDSARCKSRNFMGDIKNPDMCQNGPRPQARGDARGGWHQFTLRAWAELRAAGFANGAGVTTTMRLLATLLSPTGGEYIHHRLRRRAGAGKNPGADWVSLHRLGVMRLAHGAGNGQLRAASHAGLSLAQSTVRSDLVVFLPEVAHYPRFRQRPQLFPV